MKKTFRALPLVALLAVASGNALASSPSDVTRYDCKLPESSRPAGGARTLVYASPELVKSVVLDYGHYAGYIKPFDKSRVVGKSGDKTDVYLEVPILKGAAKIWAVLRFDPPRTVGDTEIISARMIKGNVKQMNANWKLKRTPENHTELQLEFLIVPSVPVPDSLLSSEARGAAFKAVTGLKGEALKRAAGS
jgi:ribosome-associated toxin RatA of RatAB toxin-antitoxin module